jgi:hypothetical protein
MSPVTSAATASTTASKIPLALVSLPWSSVTVSGYVRSRPLPLFIIKCLIKCYSLTIVERFEAFLVDMSVMDEDVIRAVGRGDEPEALIAKKLDSSLKRHAEKILIPLRN